MERTFRNAVLTGLIFFFAGCLTVRLPKVEIKPNAEQKTLDWESIVKAALQNNPDLKASHFNVQSSARSRDIAAGDYLPSVTGELNHNQTRTTTASSPKNSLALDVVAEQNLFSGFDATGKFIKARKDLEAAKWNYQDISANVRFRLRSAYVELLRLRKLLEVNQRIEQRRKQNAELIRLRYEAGREHLGSALRAQAIADQAAFEVRQILRRTESESLRLGREIGNGFESQVEVEGDLEKMIPKISQSAPPDFAQWAEQTPKVKKAIKTAESFKAAILSAQSTLWPQAGGTFDYGNSGPRSSELQPESFLGLKISLPFFNGGKNVEGIRKAKADYQAAKETARSTRDEVLTQSAEAWTQFVDAVELVEVRRKFLGAARKRSEIIRSEYETGLVNFQDFDIAEQDIADSERNYVESLASVLVQEANVGLIKGTTLEESQA